MPQALTDPIADLLTQVKNASRVGKYKLVIPHSNLKERVTNLLKEAGFVSQIKTTKDKFRQIEITLNEDRPVTELKRLSKPGRRLYVGAADIPKVREGEGVVIISTSQGLMIGEKARKRALGGELVCEVW